MCGYYGTSHAPEALQALLHTLGIRSYPTGQHYMLRPCNGLITAEHGHYNMSEAMWWYALHWQDGKLQPNQKITSFNARNLDSKLWRKPVNERRGLVFATEIGETKGKQHYLMEAKHGLAIGALYQDYQTPEGPYRSMALITRPPHPRFSRYHEKAIPLFIPLNSSTIDAWLDPNRPASDPQIQTLLNNPRITTDLKVTPVKTFKRAEALGPPELLAADAEIGN